MKVRFTWDRAKAERNQRDHGISFETAVEVFDDPNHAVGENFIEKAGEQRYQIIGMTRKLVQPDRDVIHLISARKAVAYEESIYNDQFR